VIRPAWPCLALLAAACTAAPERGYYAPTGASLGEALVAYREESREAVIDVRCQGAYVNTVQGRDVLTIHLQLDVARPRSGELRFPRGDLAVDIAGPPGEPRLSLPLGEAWSKREPLAGDPTVEAWTRRPFDLFFDAPDDLDGHVPDDLVVRWTARAGGQPVYGQCQFVRIPPDHLLAPSSDPIADPAFGLRDGYYLPGALKLGRRALRSSSEERLHYVFHSPSRWGL
jgi:hypothetical protein